MEVDQRRRHTRAELIVLGICLPYAVLNTIYPGLALPYGLSLLIACGTPLRSA